MALASSLISPLLRKTDFTDAERLGPLPTGAMRGIVTRISHQVAITAFLLVLAWLAHFSQSRNIGFYSDDQTFAVRPLTWSPEQFRFWLRYKTISYPEPQGRPLGFALGIILAYFGDRLGGMDGMFVVGWMVLSLNAILFYHLLRRSFAQPLPLIGAITFLLFPADTTREFLCHAHILQPSLTFMLAAAHLYLNGSRSRQIVAYFIATLCLITYESAMLPFLAVPLLETARDRQWIRRFVKHVGIIFIILAVIGLTRKLGHEYRTEELSGGKAIVVLDILAGSLIGPAAAIFAFFLRVWSVLRHDWRSPGDLIPFISISIALACSFWLSMRQSVNDRLLIDTDSRRAIQFGAAALFVSYVLSFTHFPPTCLEGQTTSVHLAAAVGGACLFAGVVVRALKFRRDCNHRNRTIHGRSLHLVAGGAGRIYHSLAGTPTVLDPRDGYLSGPDRWHADHLRQPSSSTEHPDAGELLVRQRCARAIVSVS